MPSQNCQKTCSLSSLFQKTPKEHTIMLPTRMIVTTRCIPRKPLPDEDVSEGSSLLDKFTQLSIENQDIPLLGWSDQHPNQKQRQFEKEKETNACLLEESFSCLSDLSEDEEGWYNSCRSVSDTAFLHQSCPDLGISNDSISSYSKLQLQSGQSKRLLSPKKATMRSNHKRPSHRYQRRNSVTKFSRGFWKEVGRESSNSLPSIDTTTVTTFSQERSGKLARAGRQWASSRF